MNDDPRIGTRQFLKSAAALKAVTVALDEGRRIGVPISVAIVDPSLTLVAFARDDAATPHSAETCRRKAQTAASTRKATGWMPAALAIELPMATGGLLTNVPGGSPIKLNGSIVAGIGIAGGTVEQDAQICAAVLKHLEVDPD